MSAFVWKNGYPQKGWEVIEIIDNEQDYFQCQMCNNPEVRYEHIMFHPTVGRIGVGCICAEHMVKDYNGKEAEDKKRKESNRRNNFLQKSWHENETNISRKLGKDLIRISKDSGNYWWLVERGEDENSNVYSNTPCSSELQAKKEIWQMYKDEEWL